MSSIKCVSSNYMSVSCSSRLLNVHLNVYLNVFIFQKYYCMPDLNFYQTVLNVFLLADNYTVILVFKFFYSNKASCCTRMSGWCLGEDVM